jgi:beta-galactosidase
LGGDFYPGHVTYDNFHDLALAVAYTRAANSTDAAAISPEFQSGRFQDRPRIEPSDLDLAARVSIAYGLNGLNWYMLAGGENPDDIGLFGRRHDWQAPIGPDGELRESADVVRHLGSLLSALGAPLTQSQPLADIHIGYYSAYYMTENANVRDDAIVDEIVAERETFHFDGIYRILIAASLAVGAVAIDRQEVPLDPAAVPFLWVASARYMDANTQTRLVQYAMAGGTLILGPRIPEWDLEGNACRILADGLKLPRPTYGERGTAQILDWDSVYCPLYATFSPSPSAHVLGRLAGGEPDENALILRQRVGEGSVVVVGVGLPDLYRYYHRLIRDLARSLGCSPSLGLSNPAIHAACRKGPQGSFLFVHNFDEAPQETLVTLSTGESESKALTWSLNVPARQGFLLPFGAVPLTPDLAILSTTNEMTGQPDGRITIHRTPAAGQTMLQWTGGEHDLSIVSGAAWFEASGAQIRIRWDRDEESAPIILALNRTDSTTRNTPIASNIP